MFYLDTSFLVPYFVPEKASRAVEKFLSSIKTEELAISQWTRTEFVSALGIKIRTQRFSEDAARRALAAFDEIAGQYFTVIQIMERDYLLAAEFLSQWSLGLRAGTPCTWPSRRTMGQNGYTAWIKAWSRLQAGCAFPPARESKSERRAV